MSHFAVILCVGLLIISLKNIEVNVKVITTLSRSLFAHWNNARTTVMITLRVLM